MKTAKEYFNEYAESHQNKTNQSLHYICVPLIFFSIIGLLMSIPATPIKNTINLWKSYGHSICKEFLENSRIIEDGWINNEWIKQHIDNPNLDIKYINKFLGLLAFEIWYRIFVTKEMNENYKL
mgnify:CR=1 FL=1